LTASPLGTARVRSRIRQFRGDKLDITGQELLDSKFYRSEVTNWT